MEVKGKVAIVTGASSGIGEATGRLLSEKGAKVVLSARSKEKLQQISEELSDSIVIPADMSKEEDIKNLVKKTAEKFGRIDILVNNAGVGYDADLEHIDAEKFTYLFKLDLLGYALAIREVIPFMKKQKSGSIVNISSGTALMAIPGMSPYSSLKRAVVGISLTAVEELKDDGINVSVVYPYITKTNFEKNTLNGSGGMDENDRGDLPNFDSADFVAEKILEAIKTGEKEVHVHDWMKNPR